MRQVPKYLIIGNGRLARHLCHYFSLLKIKDYSKWDRSQPIERLHELATGATHILLAIKDSAIEPFIDEHLVDIAPCAHIKILNDAFDGIRKARGVESAAAMEAALKSFDTAHPQLNAAGRRQVGGLFKLVEGVRDAAQAGDDVTAAARVKELGQGLHTLKSSLPMATKVHFSGSIVTKKAFGAHPLMTFSADLYTLDKYLAIPFVVDEKAPPFRELLPGIHNQHVRLSPQQKAKYHAACVMAGNFSCLLWQKLFDTLQEDFGFPAHIGDMYLKQQTENLLKDYKTALTGPLARGDTETIERNLKALSGDPYKAVYEAFVKAYASSHIKLREKAS
ncbi:MAG TPA: DUF2520 domain-containing protein [Patescibacteria group bacterium]|nr:DUF2520 domain-containing protein [Patescibacteria group bacterium]